MDTIPVKIFGPVVQDISFKDKFADEARQTETDQKSLSLWLR